MERVLNKNVKISYQAKEHEGYIYRQMIALTISSLQLKEFNCHVTNTVSYTKNTYTKIFLKPLKEGDNYTNCTTFLTAINTFNLVNNKRLKFNRNTVVRIKIKK